jgi:hypothetical protein
MEVHTYTYESTNFNIYDLKLSWGQKAIVFSHNLLYENIVSNV